ncbi:MAG: TetR/AcrR family transcriptional regulator [Acidimicrobiales bacterium]
MTTSTGLRARVRAELITEIRDEARRQLAAEGAPALSLRAVTRALGMAPSGIYRYFASRDDLLTALIVDAYDAIGSAAEDADAGCDRDDYGGRWRAAARAIRAWGLANPHEYALVYGSPVPGYRAPDETIGPASRVTAVLSAILEDAARGGALHAVDGSLPPLAPAAAAEGRRLAEAAFPSVPVEVALRAVGGWTQLFGMVSFELFGHFAGAVDDLAPVFERLVLESGASIGIPLPHHP